MEVSNPWPPLIKTITLKHKNFMRPRKPVSAGVSMNICNMLIYCILLNLMLRKFPAKVLFLDGFIKK